MRARLALPAGPNWAIPDREGEEGRSRHPYAPDWIVTSSGRNGGQALALDLSGVQRGSGLVGALGTVALRGMGGVSRLPGRAHGALVARGGPPARLVLGQLAHPGALPLLVLVVALAIAGKRRTRRGARLMPFAPSQGSCGGEEQRCGRHNRCVSRQDSHAWMLAQDGDRQG